MLDNWSIRIAGSLLCVRVLVRSDQGSGLEVDAEDRVADVRNDALSCLLVLYVPEISIRVQIWVQITGTYHHVGQVGVEDSLGLVITFVHLREVCTEVIHHRIELIRSVSI